MTGDLILCKVVMDDFRHQQTISLVGEEFKTVNDLVTLLGDVLGEWMLLPYNLKGLKACIPSSNICVVLPGYIPNRMPPRSSHPTVAERMGP